MSPIRTFFTFLLCILGLGACKEEYVYPDVLTEFTELKTDKTGNLANLITDRGECFTIGQAPTKYELTPDSIYRAVSVYQPLEEDPNKVQLYSVGIVNAPVPITEAELTEGMKTDPVDIQSIWKSGNYINMVLLLQVKDKGHVCHFIDQGIEQNPDGSQTLKLSFFHDRKDDYEAFTQRGNFSIPLWYYEGKLKKGDKIRFQIQTYKEGKITREFNY